MGLFSKLFKGENADGSAPAAPSPPPPPPPREKREAASEGAAAVNEDAPTTEMAVDRGMRDLASAIANAKDAGANTNATEELVLPPDVQELTPAAAPPAPPPPPAATPASKTVATAKAAPAAPPLPPPPVGAARDGERARTASATRSTGAKSSATSKSSAANKAVAAAAAATPARKALSPLPPPPIAAGAVAPEPAAAPNPPVRRSKAETIRGFVAPVLLPDQAVVSAVTTTPVETPAPEPEAAPPAAPGAAAAEVAAAPALAGAAHDAATAPALRGEAPSSTRTGEFEHAVDAAVDNLLDQAAAAKDEAAIEAERAADRRAAAETFHAIVAANAAPVRELMFQLSVGRTPRKWAGSCRSVLAPLLAGAQQIELVELSEAFTQLDRALERAAAEASAYIGADTAAEIARAYGRLNELLPQAFTALSERDGRRLMLLESLLLQVPAMNRRVLAKLYGAGLSTLDHLSGAAADEISVVAGIDRKIAAALSTHLERFERERDRLDPVDARAQVHERLRTVLGRLRSLQEEFEQAEQDEAADRKRVARRGREIASLELEVLLLEIGELALTEELKRRAVRHKIQRLESYLEHAQASA